MIKGMNHLTLGVADISTSFNFYKNILGLTPLVKWDYGAYFLVGSPNPAIPGSGFWFCIIFDKNHKPTPGNTHYAFSVPENEFEQMAKKIMDSGCQQFQDNTTPGKSLYFLDPDGHKLEIHVGTPEMRLGAKKKNLGNWKNVEWFV